MTWRTWSTNRQHLVSYVVWTTEELRQFLDHVKDPDEAGERLIALDPATVNTLRQRFAEEASERLTVGSRWPSRKYEWRGHRDDPVSLARHIPGGVA